MTEGLSPHQERHLKGIELAFDSNAAYDRLQEAIAKLKPYAEAEVETPEMDRLFRDVIPVVDELYEDFGAYCAAAGALLLSEQPSFVRDITETV